MSTCTVVTGHEREVVITRVFDASRPLVFAALTDPELVRRWLVGPPGWLMTVCEIDPRVGRPYRYVWQSPDGVEIEMHGTYMEVAPPGRLVVTELLLEPNHRREAIATSVLVERGGETILTTTVVYESREARDAALASHTANAERRHDRLKGLLAPPILKQVGNKGGRLKRIAAGLTLVASALGSASGWPSAPTPNLSGRWVLDLAKTQQPRLAPPRWQCCASGPTVVTIDHQEPSLTITTETVGIDYNGKVANHVKLVERVFTDGRESVNVNPVAFDIAADGWAYYQENGRPRLPPRVDYYDVAHHESRTLVVRSVSAAGAARVWRWSMTSDGAELTARLYFNEGNERAHRPDTTLVFARANR